MGEGMGAAGRVGAAVARLADGAVLTSAVQHGDVLCCCGIAARSALASHGRYNRTLRRPVRSPNPFM